MPYSECTRTRTSTRVRIYMHCIYDYTSTIYIYVYAHQVVANMSNVKRIAIERKGRTVAVHSPPFLYPFLRLSLTHSLGRFLLSSHQHLSGGIPCFWRVCTRISDYHFSPAFPHIPLHPTPLLSSTHLYATWSLPSRQPFLYYFRGYYFPRRLFVEYLCSAPYCEKVNKKYEAKAPSTL